MFDPILNQGFSAIPLAPDHPWLDLLDRLGKYMDTAHLEGGFPERDLNAWSNLDSVRVVRTADEVTERTRNFQLHLGEDAITSPFFAQQHPLLAPLHNFAKSSQQIGAYLLLALHQKGLLNSEALDVLTQSHSRVIISHSPAGRTASERIEQHPDLQTLFSIAINGNRGELSSDGQVLPANSLLIWTNECIELATDGNVKAFEHCVRVPQADSRTTVISQLNPPNFLQFVQRLQPQSRRLPALVR